MNKMFLFGEYHTEYSFENFIKWAYSQIDTPTIRGVLIEYLVVECLLKNAVHIAGERIAEYEGCKKIDEKSFEKCLRKHYGYQPHGDIYDFQLHWGLTFEIKSTMSRKNWTLDKTCRWNVSDDKLTKAKIFPAQYYILAEMPDQRAENTDGEINFGDVRFYVRTGRELDEITAKKKNGAGSQWVTFLQFIRDTPSCSIAGLPDQVRDAINREIAIVNSKIRKGASLKSTKNEGMPLVFETEVKKQILRRLAKTNDRWEVCGYRTNPWKKDEAVDWRDWEGAGFKYDTGRPPYATIPNES